MPKTKLLRLAIIALLIPVFCILNQLGCTVSSDPKELSRHLEPLCIRRASGRVDTITFAQAMAWHHVHEHNGEHSADAVTFATPPKTSGSGRQEQNAKHEEGFCVGVATGYQAIRYAAARIFAGEIPYASDFELSVVGSMRGVWDVISLYTGKTLARPKGKGRKMSLESFTFTAKRVSTGKTLTFRLREGLISPEFYRLKNRGVGCDDPALELLKKQASLKILSLRPDECFECRVP